ncbi:MAG: heparan-alpha-glucosaminide N-acetyltransferase domain-containing protein [Sandaracinus sp.]
MTGPEGSAPRTGPRSRVAFVDWLRLLAALQMITGHTTDAVLADAERASAWFSVWTQIRGLTAPAFLLASGVSFGLASRLDDASAYAVLRAREGARRRRVVRSAWLVVLGTLLHALDAPWVVDVLQCVGATLLALDLLVTLAPRPDAVVGIAGVLALTILVSAPSVDAAIAPADHEGAARFVLGWVDRDGGSLFPLIPWAFYVLAGIAIGRLAIPRGARTEGSVVIARLAVAAIGCGVAAFVAEALFGAADAHGWSSHPAVVLTRTAMVLLMAACLAALGTRWELPHFGGLAWGSTLAGETLVLYVAHLLVLFADGVGPGRVWAHALSLPATIALSIAMVIGSAIAALAWARFWPPIEARWMPWLRPGRGPAKTGA